MTPNLRVAATAAGLPWADKAVLRAFDDDVVYGRIPKGLTAAQVRERYYTPPTAAPSGNGKAPARFISEPAPRVEDDDLDDYPERAWSGRLPDHGDSFGACDD